jgi:hypothetical protein
VNIVSTIEKTLTQDFLRNLKVTLAEDDAFACLWNDPECANEPLYIARHKFEQVICVFNAKNGREALRTAALHIGVNESAIYPLAHTIVNPSLDTINPYQYILSKIIKGLEQN